MLQKRERVNAALALIVIAAVALACSSLKNLGKNPKEEVNKLVRETNQDLEEINKIDEEAEEKERNLNQAARDKNVDEVKKILGELIKDIDRGTEIGQSAVDKIDRASKMDIDPAYKDFLAKKAEAFRKQLEAYKALREAAEIARDSYTKDGMPSDKSKQYTDKINEY